MGKYSAPSKRAQANHKSVTEVATPEYSNSAGCISARDNATVHVGNRLSHQVFYGGNHTHDTEAGGARETILSDLARHSYRERKDINPERVANTCEWFLSHHRYKQWRQHPSSSMLRVSADPGCGKSVLARHLVDEELSNSARTTTSYFFFKDGFVDQSSATVALRCIIHQILVQRPILFSDAILKKFRQSSYILNSTIELWDIILEIGSNSRAGEVIIVLDAFDECSNSGRLELEEIICRFYSKPRSESNIKLILTSRPRDIITRGFRSMEKSDLPVLHLAGENEEEVRMIAKEIDIVIAARVQDLASRLRLTSDVAESLRIRLSGFDNRTYLWVHLTLDVFKNTDRTSSNAISDIIEQLPKSVYDAYEQILDRSSDDIKARKLLEVMLAATRPLKLAELAEVLELEAHHLSHAEIRMRIEPKAQDYLRNLCGLFIVVIKSEVFFLHQTAREFLLRNEVPAPIAGKRIKAPASSRVTSSDAGLGSWKWAHTIEMRQAQCSISQLCVMYLLLWDFSDDADASQHRSKVENTASAFAFLKYASQNWYKHCREAECAGIPTKALLRLLGFPRAESNGSLWRKEHDNSRRRSDLVLEGLSPLMIASITGLKPAVKVLLKANPMSAKDTDKRSGRSALSFAAEQGFDDIVEPMLQFYKRKLRGTPANRHIDTSDIHGQTPLSFATLNDHTVIARRLLKAGARPDIKDQYLGTPTLYGLCSKDDQMIKLMRHYTSRSDQKLFDQSLADMLSFAILEGRTKIIKRAIGTKRVKATSTCPSEQVLNDYSLTQGYSYISRITSVWINAQRRATQVLPRTVSQLAASVGESSFFKAFEDIGDPVDVMHCDDANGSTILHWAAALGRYSVTIIDELLSRGALIDQRETLAGSTPLHWALWAGNYVNAEVLLSRGADIQIQTLDKQSAFKMGQWPDNAIAFLREDKNSFKLAGLQGKEGALLLDFVSAWDEARPGPTKASRRDIKTIAAREQVDTPQQVLASILLDEENFAQPLQYWEDAFNQQPDFQLRYLIAAAAALEGRYDVLNCLLRRGMDTRFQDSLGRTLLHLLPPPTEASLLLDAGTDPNVQDKCGRTALHEAVWDGQSPLVELLLGRGADPSKQDEDGLTPLQESLYVTIYAASLNPYLELGVEAISTSILGFEYHAPGAEDIGAIVAMLIDTGAAIEAQNSGGWTALHIAAELGLGDITKRLIDVGASVSVRDASGNTPLHLAHARRHESIIQKLVRAGADQTAENAAGVPATGVHPPHAAREPSVAGRLKRKRKTSGEQASRKRRKRRR